MHMIKKTIITTILLGILMPTINQCALQPATAPLSTINQETLNQTLLHATAFNRPVSEIEQLINAGADCNTQGICGETPLLNAISCQNTDVIDTLLLAGASAQIANNNNKTPLMFAVRHRNIGLVKKLLATGAQIDAQSAVYGETALMLAAQAGYFNILETLIETGADESPKDFFLYKTVLSLMRDFGHTAKLNSIQKILVQRADKQQACEQRIKRGIPEDNLQLAHTYIIDGPLAIKELTDIFLQYLTPPSDPLKAARLREIEGEEIQKDRDRATKERVAATKLAI